MNRTTLISAFSWTTGGAALSVLLNLLRSVILARLLYPADFGLVGLATSFMSTLTMLTEINLTAKYMVTEWPADKEERAALDTMWTAGLMRGAILSLLIIAAAKPVASWFHDDRLVGVMIAISAVPLVAGLENVGLVKLRRELRFRPLVTQRQAAEMVAFGTTVAVAVLTRNYLALIISQLTATVVLTVLSFQLCTYRPRFLMNRQHLVSSLSFSKHLFLVGLLTVVTSQFDSFAIGRVLDASAVGTYLVAYRLAMFPVDLTSRVLTSVLFPTYAQVAVNDPSRLAAVFGKVSTVTATVVLLAVCPLALAPGDIIAFVYGNRWSEAAGVLAVLAFAGVCRSLAHAVAPVLVASGRPDLDSKCKMIEAVVFISVITVLIERYGMMGAACASLISYSLAYLLRVVVAVRLFRMSPLCFAHPLASASAAFALAILARTLSASPLLVVIVYVVALSTVLLVISGFVRSEVRTAATALQRWVAAP